MGAGTYLISESLLPEDADEQTKKDRDLNEGAHIIPHHPYKLKEGDKFTPGLSTRTYVVKTNYDSMRDF